MPVRRCLRSLEFTGSSPKFRQPGRDPRVFPIVKRIAVVLPLLCLPFAGMAKVPRALEVPVAIGVLADLPTDAVPPKPVSWTSPTGPIVLHGDLFKDGRHLALVASDGTTLALAGKDGWEILGRWEVLPAWVPAGEKAEDLGYENCSPPEVPFVLKDLTGDGVPEALVAFENDGYSVGYRILKKKGEGAELLKIGSQSGEPRFESGLMVVCSANRARKAWGAIDSFYRWTNDAPLEVGSFGEDCSDPDKVSLFAVRHLPDGTEQGFEMKKGEGVLLVNSGKLDGFQLSDAKHFAVVREVGKEEAPELSDVGAVLFERMTGVPGELCMKPEARDDFKKAKAGMKLEVEGSEEAKRLLGAGM